ncbi:MAG: hypothetical protein KDA61_17315 [Planctomycetales bacterium]|nr:hypothetical protein [Planctomycetales bacterium]
MSERERWVVYPLLFLALGAAIRDKVLHAVETDELHCKRIFCEQVIADDVRSNRQVAGQLTSEAIVTGDVLCGTMSVLDPDDQKRFLAQLGVATSPGADGKPRRVGRLLLTDSEGAEIFGLADDFLQMRNIRCESVTITDPESPQVVLAKLGFAQLKAADGPETGKRVGVLALNNQEVVNVLGLPNVPQAEQSSSGLRPE